MVEFEPATNSGWQQPRFSHEEIFRASIERPDLHFFKDISALEPSEQKKQFTELLKTFAVEDRVCLLVAWIKEKANAVFVSGHHLNAIGMYQDAIKVALKNGSNYLSPNYLNFGYINALEIQTRWTLLFDLVSCCNNIAQSYSELKETSKALDWLQEVEIIYECHKIINTPKEFHPEGALGIRSKVLEHCTYHMKAALRFSRIFAKLRNTATSGFYAFRCITLYPSWYPEDVPEIRKLQRECYAVNSLSHRSPDFNCIDDWDVEDPALQVRGIWNKLPAQASFRPRNRQGSASWISESKLYVFAGEIPGAEPLVLWDLWCLDLKSADNSSWRRLPDLPEDFHSIAYRAKKAIVYENYAWIFNGYFDILRFNLITEIWDTVTTTMETGVWPYRDVGLCDPCIELYENFLYVFGGDQSELKFGCDIFMVLDLRLLRWELLGGSATRSRSSFTPQYRRAAASWVSPLKKRLYVMYGSSYYYISDGPTTTSEESKNVENYEDIWSYSFVDKTWNRERIRGNFPSARDSMASVYHPTLDIVVIFGGYNDSMPTPSGPDDTIYKGTNFTYYADTFVMDISTGIWRQVVLRNFPCWRSGAHCLFDNSTGIMHLFGGSSSREYINFKITSGPKHYLFGDIWRLDLDIPGCVFDEKAFFDGSPFLKVGPWRRCFACKNIGRRYLRCQGTCEGNYIFCSHACQRVAWQAHKAISGCRKY